MGNAGRNGGEYYTPRPLIRAMVRVTDPQIGETIYDGAVGSAGFLCEAYDYLQAQNPDLTTEQVRTLQERTFYGKEKKSLAYVIAIMNMILHGIEAPNILHTNTLTENLADVQEKDRYDVVLANPPFGGKERKEVQQNFPIRTGETAFLFLQHFIKMLKAGGRGAVVIKNTFLSNTDNASVSLRKLLLESCDLHTVLDCPSGTFQGAGVKTVVLFFEKGAPTRKVWYYQLDPGRNLGKTNPLNDDDLAEFVELQKTKADSPKSWSVDAADIDPTTLRPLREEPRRRRGGRAPQPAGDPGRDRGAGCGERGGAGEDQGAAVKTGGELRRLGEVVDHWLGQDVDKPSITASRSRILPKVNVDGSIRHCRTSDDDDVTAEEARQMHSASRGLVIVRRRRTPARAGHLEMATSRLLRDRRLIGFASMSTERSSVPTSSYYAHATGPDGTLASHFTGTGIQRSPGRRLRRLELPDPPLAEQQRIVGILDEAFDGIAAAQSQRREEPPERPRPLRERPPMSSSPGEGEGWVKGRLGERR